MSQKNVIQEQDREKEEQVSSFKFPVLPFVQTAKIQSIRTLFAENADFITGDKF